jgi:hypothetical protein
MREKIVDGYRLQGLGVTCLEDDFGGNAGFKCLLPAQDAQAPFIAWLKTWKAVPRGRSHQIIALILAKFEKRCRYYCADGVSADILRAGLTVAVAKETSSRREAATFEFGAKDVLWARRGVRWRRGWGRRGRKLRRRRHRPNESCRATAGWSVNGGASCRNTTPEEQSLRRHKTLRG